MSVIIYKPKDTGKELITKKGKVIKVKKYHMTPKEMTIGRDKWLEEIKNVDKKIVRKADPYFFNPYRHGIYYYQIQTLFLLGTNEWHGFQDIIKKLREYTLGIVLKHSIYKKYGYHTAWDKFRGKKNRDNAQRCKDYIGRIQENFMLLQRLSKLHPYGYKLYQVYAAIDIKRNSKKGFEQGICFYRLSTYNSKKESFPIKDFTDFELTGHKNQYVNRRFVGTIITKDKTMVKGVDV